VTIPFVDTQMLSALELLHYCKRFENTLFAFLFEHATQCSEVLMDLRVLMAARIRQVIFCSPDESLSHLLSHWNRTGNQFSIREAAIAELNTERFLAMVRADLADGKAPFVTIRDLPDSGDARERAEADIIQSAVTLGAKKMFFPGGQPCLTINGKSRSYPTVDEVRAALAQGDTFNISPGRVQFLIEQQELHEIDLVLVEARRGSIYEEVFTHAGSGTLFTEEYPNILRSADESDVRDVMALMQPYIVEGTLKPMREEELLAMIRSFTVYSVNGQIVAAGALINYGESCELAKLCTLPRFQARGRARALVRSILDRAKDSGKRSVFALTVNSYVGEFFERVGFKPVPRESLPAEWKAGYDFSRDSKAYEYVL
jgi:N-acetylglutamate synthase-like GNAT family acetyltransferase